MSKEHIEKHPFFNDGSSLLDCKKELFCCPNESYFQDDYEQSVLPYKIYDFDCLR